VLLKRDGQRARVDFSPSGGLPSQWLPCGATHLPRILFFLLTVVAHRLSELEVFAESDSGGED